MKRTYYRTIPQSNEKKYKRTLRKLNITYTTLPNSEPGYITLLFACTWFKKMRLKLIFNDKS